MKYGVNIFGVRKSVLGCRVVKIGFFDKCAKERKRRRLSYSINVQTSIVNTNEVGGVELFNTKHLQNVMWSLSISCFCTMLPVLAKVHGFMKFPILKSIIEQIAIQIV